MMFNIKNNLSKYKKAVFTWWKDINLPGFMWLPKSNQWLWHIWPSSIYKKSVTSMWRNFGLLFFFLQNYSDSVTLKACWVWISSLLSIWPKFELWVQNLHNLPFVFLSYSKWSLYGVFICIIALLHNPSLRSKIDTQAGKEQILWFHQSTQIVLIIKKQKICSPLVFPHPCLTISMILCCFMPKK